MSKKVQKEFEEDELEYEEPNHARKKLLLFFLLIVIIGVTIGCFFSPVFNLEKVVIHDGTYVNKEEIQNAISVAMGENVFQIDYTGLEKSVETLPFIQVATTKLKLPNTIEISYTERVPIAYIKYLESYLVMDQYGYVLELIREKKYGNLPIIYNIEFESYEVGKQLSDTAKTKYDNVVYLLENAKQDGFPYTISEINYESISNVKMWVLEEDIEIVYGEINRNTILEKIRYLSGILGKVKGKKGKIDLSSSNYLEKTVFTERY